MNNSDPSEDTNFCTSSSLRSIGWLSWQRLVSMSSTSEARKPCVIPRAICCRQINKHSKQSSLKTKQLGCRLHPSETLRWSPCLIPAPSPWNIARAKVKSEREKEGKWKQETSEVTADCTWISQEAMGLDGEGISDACFVSCRHSQGGDPHLRIPIKPFSHHTLNGPTPPTFYTSTRKYKYLYTITCGRIHARYTSIYLYSHLKTYSSRQRYSSIPHTCK